VLVLLFITAVLGAVGIYAIARCVLAALDRMGVDPMTVLVWLGLAERPFGPRR
jgi:hypothetical protein